MDDQGAANPAWETAIELALLLTAQHPNNGLAAWDAATTRSLLLLRKALGTQLRFFVSTHTTKRLAHISALPNLRDLSVSYRPTQDGGMGPLLSASGLTRLSLSGCRYVTDVGPLAQLPLLQALNLSMTRVSDLLPLRDLLLRTLCLDSAAFKDLSPLSCITSLEELDLTFYRGVTINALSQLTRLIRLNLWFARVTDVAPITGLKLKTLVLSGSDVTQLGPLSMMTSLEILDLSDCPALSDIAPLARLTLLSCLGLSGTDVSDLSPLEHLPLQYLDGSLSPVTSLHPLAGIPTLQELLLLHCDQSLCRDITALSRLRVLSLGPKGSWEDLEPIYRLQLEELHLRWSGVSDLGPLSGMSTLQKIDVSCCSDLQDLEPIRCLQLEELYLDYTGVSDVGPLSGMATLQKINMRGCKLSDVTPLAPLIGLRHLCLASTLVSDLFALQSLHQLTELDLSLTRVSDARPLAAMCSLQVLRTSGCPMSDIAALASLTALRCLDLSDTQVSEVSPLQGLRQLTSLELSGTPAIDMLGLEDMHALQVLRIYECDATWKSMTFELVRPTRFW